MEKRGDETITVVLHRGEDYLSVTLPSGGELIFECPDDDEVAELETVLMQRCDIEWES